MKLNVPEYSSRMVKSLPSFYLTEDIKHDNVLERYLISVFVGGSNDILSSINHTEDFIDPYKCPTEDLPHLFKSWGMTYEPTLDENYQRKLIANIGEIYKRKGSYSCVKYLVRSITGRDCDIIYQKSDDGERKLDVTLIASSINDIVSGEIEKATYAIQKILPQFLPFYLVPNASFSSPKITLDSAVRNKGFRVAERVSHDFTLMGLPNIFVNSDFYNGTEGWDSTEGHMLSVSSVKKDGARCLESISENGSYFYQDVLVKYKDIYSAKAYFMCPSNQAKGITMKILLTFFRSDGSVIHSILNAQTSLFAREKWCSIKRDIYVDEKLCTKIRISFHCSVSGQLIYFSSPLLLSKNREGD